MCLLYIIYCIYNVQYLYIYEHVACIPWDQKLERFKDEVWTPCLWTLEVNTFDRDEWRGRWDLSCKRSALSLLSSQDLPEVAAVLSDTTREASESFAETIIPWQMHCLSVLFEQVQYSSHSLGLEILWFDRHCFFLLYGCLKFRTPGNQ